MAYFIDGVEYAKEKYDSLREFIDTTDRPVDTFESVYYLDAENKIYVPRERTEEEKVDWYVQIVQEGTITIEEVPEEYRAQVEVALAPTEGPTEEQAVIDSIMQGVAEYEY